MKVVEIRRQDQKKREQGRKKRSFRGCFAGESRGGSDRKRSIRGGLPGAGCGGLTQKSYSRAVRHGGSTTD